MKRYVAELENDFERAYQKSRKEFGKKIPESLFDMAVRARNNYLCGLMTAREAVNEIMEAWNAMELIF